MLTANPFSSFFLLCRTEYSNLINLYSYLIGSDRCVCRQRGANKWMLHLVLHLDLGEITRKPALECVLRRMENRAESRVYTYCPPLVCSSCPKPFVDAKSFIASVVAGFVNHLQNYHINESVAYLHFRTKLHNDNGFK